MNNTYKIIIAVLVCLILVAVTVLGVLLVQRYSDAKLPSKPGLYDADKSCLATWDELVNTYGMKTAGFSYGSNNDKYLSKIMSDNRALSKGTILVVDSTYIYDSMFAGCKNLTNIILPDELYSIGDNAFSGCENLTSITIPDTVMSIGQEAFSNCKSLEKATLSNGMLAISTKMFEGCTSLKSITIPDNVLNIGESAFTGSTSLTSVSIGENVSTIGSNAFSGCTSLKSITIPNSVTSVGNSAFAGCTSLTNATISKGILEISDKMFAGCTSLTKVSIGKNVSTIGSYAFSGCTSLMSITIPYNVMTIRSLAFQDCTSLTTIKFEGTVAEWQTTKTATVWITNAPAKKVICSDGEINFGSDEEINSGSDGEINSDYSKLDIAKIIAENPSIKSHVSEDSNRGKFTYVSINSDATLYYYHNSGEITYLYEVDTDIGLRAYIHITAKYGDFEHAYVTYNITGANSKLRAAAFATIDATQKTIQIDSLTDFFNYDNVNREEVLEELNANLTTAVNILQDFMSVKLGIPLR